MILTRSSLSRKEFCPSGGPLKYALEGHKFAIFGCSLTQDHRYVVSISNRSQLLYFLTLASIRLEQDCGKGVLWIHFTEA